MKNIALAFSGGGFRAAAYSLGCLSYLNHVKLSDNEPLLQKVKYISSTSGGSITNLFYSSYIFRGKSFKDFFDFLNYNLEGDKLLADTLKLLKNEHEWKNRPDKSINLINAFSMVYDKILEQQNFGLYSNRNNNPHLEEICVNSTEFTNGLPFRFQSQYPDKNFPKGNIGNKYIYFKKKEISAAEKIKLSDILASSSCFPSGFEPMIFPKDYANSEVSVQELRNSISFTANEYTLKDKKTEYNSIDFIENKDFKKEIQFGIMDGGIADNQGIDAFIRADDRRKKNGKNEFDLFISCDVTSYLMDGYTLPVQKKKWYDIFSINFILVIIALFSLWLPYILLFNKGIWQPWKYVTGTISSLFFLLSIYLIYLFAKSKNKKSTSTWSTIFNKYKGIFSSLGLGVLKKMLFSRAKSVFILSNDIYLKQIRRMYYANLFIDERYKNRVIQNAIYDLSKAKFSGKNISTNDLHPSKVMIEVAEKARIMATTLWFDEKHQEDNIKNCIIATGQFTTCYNLLKFLKDTDVSIKTSELLHLEKVLLDDFEKFSENPFYLI